VKNNKLPLVTGGAKKCKNEPKGENSIGRKKGGSRAASLKRSKVKRPGSGAKINGAHRSQAISRKDARSVSYVE